MRKCFSFPLPPSLPLWPCALCLSFVPPIFAACWEALFSSGDRLGKSLPKLSPFPPPNSFPAQTTRSSRYATPGRGTRWIGRKIPAAEPRQPPPTAVYRAHPAPYGRLSGPPAPYRRPAGRESRSMMILRTVVWCQRLPLARPPGRGQRRGSARSAPPNPPAASGVRRGRYRAARSVPASP